MPDAYIFDHVRTPRGRGKADGGLHAVPAVRMVEHVLRSIQSRSQLETRLLDDVVLGCVTPVQEQGADVARVAALLAGYDETVPGTQLNRFCASGLEAINVAAAQVMAGQSSAVVAGGVESMSRVPMGADGGAWYSDPAVSGALAYVPQGIGADLIATMDGYTRSVVDRYAAESHRRAALAWREGRFTQSVIPVVDALGAVLLDRDETIRPDTSAATLARLKPAFATLGEHAGFDTRALLKYPSVEAIHHVHTAGNSSGIVDGAAAVLIGDREFGAAIGRTPRARIRAFTSVGSEPTIMLTGPALVTEKLLRRAGMTVGDIDLFEVNEAFAAVVLRFIGHFGLDPERVNVNGGAIAMGHPLGATGAMLLGTVLDELERRGGSTALITLCVGAGMGTATVIERI